MDGYEKIAIVRAIFGRVLGGVPDSRSGFFFWLRSTDGRATRLPTVVVDEFLNRLPFGMTEFDGWISKIDKTSDLNMLRDP